VSAHSWPPGQAPLAGAGERVVVVDLRGLEAEGADALVGRLDGMTGFLVAAFAALRDGGEPAALVVRHQPAASGRLSGSLLGELSVSGSRSFMRQLRYDRSWVDTPLVFVDGRDATDDELSAIVEAALTGDARIEVERSSGRTAAFGWERGHGL
jgi:hypothetical protein